MPQFVIRPLGIDEVSVPVDWAAAEGWNPGVSDVGPFWHQDPQGFLGGFLDGTMIACISAVRYDATFGFVGFYIVAPGWRGQGYGIQMWDAALAHLADVRTVGLDGVVDQQSNYRKSGFALAYRSVRYAGLAAPGYHPDVQDNARGLRLVPAAETALDSLVRYDAEHFGAERTRFVRDWIAAPGHHGIVAETSGSRIAGYGVIRPCRDGYKVGPLFAADSEIAAHLLSALLATVTPGSPVFLDPPVPNAAAVEMVSRLGWRPIFETARMYRGDPLQLPVNELFGVTTFELG
jgi:hypothetical protein